MQRIPVYALEDLNAPLMGAARYVFKKEAPEILAKKLSLSAPGSKPTIQRSTLRIRQDHDKKTPIVKPNTNKPLEDARFDGETPGQIEQSESSD